MRHEESRTEGDHADRDQSHAQANEHWPRSPRRALSKALYAFAAPHKGVGKYRHQVTRGEKVKQRGGA